MIPATPSTVPLAEAEAVVRTILLGTRRWRSVGPAFDEVTHGEAVLVTDDGWTFRLRVGDNELDHVARLTAPDGRHGDAAVWTPEAQARGTLWGDPLDVLQPPEWDWFVQLALDADA